MTTAYHSGPRTCNHPGCNRPTETDRDSDGFIVHFAQCGEHIDNEAGMNELRAALEAALVRK